MIDLLALVTHGILVSNVGGSGVVVNDGIILIVNDEAINVNGGYNNITMIDDDEKIILISSDDTTLINDDYLKVIL